MHGIGKGGIMAAGATPDLCRGDLVEIQERSCVPTISMHMGSIGIIGIIICEA